MNEIEQRKFIYGAMFLLANKLQVIGDRMDSSITTKQYFFMVTVSQFREYQPTLSELAEFMGSSRQNIKKTGVILETKEMITLQKDEQDQRAWRISLTATGVHYLEQREADLTLFLDQLFENVTDNQMQYMAEGLLRIAGNITKME